jgi:hypothetical protein
MPPGYYIPIEFATHVEDEGQDKNCVTVTAYCVGCSDTDTGQDCATINGINCSGCVNPPDGLIAWWPFDEHDGIISYDIVGSNDGTWNMGMGSYPTPGPGKVDYKIRTGHDSYILVKNDPSLNFGTNDFTIDCWIQHGLVSPECRMTIIDKGKTGYKLQQTSDCTLEMILGDHSYVSTLNIPWSEWTFIAAIVDRTNNLLTLYVNDDSESFSLSDLGTTSLTNSEDVFIGLDQLNPVCVGPAIDELEIFDRALDDNEVMRIYYADEQGKCKPDLCCNGTCNWYDVEPGESKTCSFMISNCGDPGSELDWEICSTPGWGTWTFSPANGQDVTPATSPQTITATVTAPNTQEQTFSGYITICNAHNPTDNCTIPVTLTTPKNKAVQTPMMQFIKLLFQNHPQMFPLLNLLLLLLLT